MVYGEEGERTGLDLKILPLQGEPKPVVYLATSFNERSAQFSPDGKWMAYQSNESGRYEIYVQPVPATGAKRQVSLRGGIMPRWRRDASELFFDSKLMAAPAKLVPSGYDFGAPRQLFDRTIPPMTTPDTQARYQPSPDRQRFLVALPVETASKASDASTIFTNWQAALKGPK